MARIVAIARPTVPENPSWNASNRVIRFRGPCKATFRNGQASATSTISRIVMTTSVGEMAMASSRSALEGTSPTTTAPARPDGWVTSSQQGWMNILYGTPAMDASSTVIVSNAGSGEFARAVDLVSPEDFAAVSGSFADAGVGTFACGRSADRVMVLISHSRRPTAKTSLPPGSASAESVERPLADLHFEHGSEDPIDPLSVYVFLRLAVAEHQREPGLSVGQLQLRGRRQLGPVET